MSQRREPGPDWDWVTERAKCSIPKMFEELRGLASRDTETRNQQVGRRRFVFYESEDTDVKATSFSVIDSAGGGNPDRVEFRLMEVHIEIQTKKQGAPGGPVQVRLTLTDQAGCKFLIGSETLDPWQVCKRALEPVLFG